MTTTIEQRVERIEKRLAQLEGVVEAIEAADVELAESSNDRAVPVTLGTISVTADAGQVTQATQ